MVTVPAYIPITPELATKFWDHYGYHRATFRFIVDDTLAKMTKKDLEWFVNVSLGISSTFYATIKIREYLYPETIYYPDWFLPPTTNQDLITLYKSKMQSITKVKTAPASIWLIKGDVQNNVKICIRENRHVVTIEQLINHWDVQFPVVAYDFPESNLKQALEFFNRKVEAFYQQGFKLAVNLDED